MAKLINIIKKEVLDFLDVNTFFKVINIRNYLKNTGIKIKYEKKNRFFIAEDASKIIFFAQRGRYRRYDNGIENFARHLAKDYLLDNIELQNNMVLIDCGANIGELGLWCQIEGIEYIGIEPEMLEYQCCVLNNKGSNVYNCALWKTSGELIFYSKPRTADSSLIKIDQSQEISVMARKLDELIIPEPGKIYILKVEAEGAEPEILQGANSILRLMSYVTVDCGYERGVQKEHTFVETNKILQGSGFSLLAANLKRGVFLYEKSD